MTAYRCTASDLAQHLEQLQLDGLPSVEITAIITDSIATWGRQRCWRPTLEHKLPVYRYLKNGEAVQGRVDLFLERHELPSLVIEIDRGNKGWSLEKLKHAVATGSEAIWVRWGRPCALEVPSSIKVVHITVEKRKRVRRQRSISP